jgi:hypothetical protein
MALRHSTFLLHDLAGRKPRLFSFFLDKKKGGLAMKLFFALLLAGWSLLLVGLLAFPLLSSLTLPYAPLMMIFSWGIVFATSFPQSSWALLRSLAQRSALYLPGALLTLALAWFLVREGYLLDGLAGALLLLILPTPLPFVLAWRIHDKSIADFVFPIYPDAEVMMIHHLTRAYLQHGVAPEPTEYSFKESNDRLSLTCAPKTRAHQAALAQARHAIAKSMLLYRWGPAWDDARVTNPGDFLRMISLKLANPTRFLLTPPPLSAHERMVLLTQTDTPAVPS